MIHTLFSVDMERLIRASSISSAGYGYAKTDPPQSHNLQHTSNPVPNPAPNTPISPHHLCSHSCPPVLRHMVYRGVPKALSNVDASEARSQLDSLSEVTDVLENMTMELDLIGENIFSSGILKQNLQ